MFSRPKMVYSAGSTFCFLRGRFVAPDLLRLTHFRMSLWDFADMQSTCTRLHKFVFYNCKLCDFSCTPAKSLKKHMMKNHTMKFQRVKKHMITFSLILNRTPFCVGVELLKSVWLQIVKYKNTPQLHKYTATTQLRKYTANMQIHCSLSCWSQSDKKMEIIENICSVWSHQLINPFTLLFPFIQSRIKFPSRKGILWSLH